MYTKILLFLLIFNVIPQTASNGNATQKKHIAMTNSQTTSGEISMHSNGGDQRSNAATADWSDIGQHFQGHHSSDDDGKTHYVHFERYLRRKNRNLYCITCKIILLLTYLCSLITTYYHLLH